MRTPQYLTFLICCTIFTLSPAESSAQIGDLLWEDEFEDLDNWVIDIGNGSWGWGNGELQYYKEENVSIVEVPGEPGNNALRIRAQQESGAGITDQWGNPLSYTSGKVRSLSEVSMLYGMVEARIRVPDLQTGGWPAMWMLGTSNMGWPRQGELDLMEMGAQQSFRDTYDSYNGGLDMDNSTVNEMTGANVHYFSESAQNPGNPNGVLSIAFDEDYNRPYFNQDVPFNDRFLIHRMYWDETSVRFTVEDDGQEYDLYTGPFPIEDATDAFKDPFYFILNMAIGGTYTDAYNLGDPNTGAPVSLSLPADMYVDYIRVYEWNGQGSIHLGPPVPEVGTFGVYTDLTPVDAAHAIDEDAYVFVWEGTLNGAQIPPAEGQNVLSWSTAGSGWFGAGILSEQPINLSGFQEGSLDFRIQIPGNVDFQIGITDAWGNDHYVQFPAGQTTYGLVRNGEWGQASIPVTDLAGEFIDLRMLAYTFVILEVSGASCEFALDDILWTGGIANSLSEGEDPDPFHWHIVPQPAQDILRISMDLENSAPLTFHLFDLQGREQKNFQLGSSMIGNQVVELDIQDVASGSYVLQARSGSSMAQQVIIVAR